MDSLFAGLRRSIEENRLVGVATVVGGGALGAKMLLYPDGRVEGDLGVGEGVREQLLDRCRELLAAGHTRYLTLEHGGEVFEVFFESHAPPPKLVVVGAVHVAIPLVAIANAMGFRTVVVDARSVYATEERFPHADELILGWPHEALAAMELHESTFCVFLTHDFKLDNPGLEVALRSRARYVGALGSKRTHAKRIAQLRDLGLEQSEIERIHAPIGLPLGGNRPEEIAVSIAAEIVAARNGRA